MKAVKHEASYDKVNSWNTDKRLNIYGYIETPEKALQSLFTIRIPALSVFISCGLNTMHGAVVVSSVLTSCGKIPSYFKIPFMY